MGKKTKELLDFYKNLRALMCECRLRQKDLEKHRNDQLKIRLARDAERRLDNALQENPLATKLIQNDLFGGQYGCER